MEWNEEGVGVEEEGLFPNSAVTVDCEMYSVFLLSLK